LYKAHYKKHILKFKKPSGTSRGVITEKETWFIFIEKDDKPGCVGIGECSIIKGLSVDARVHYEEMLREVCADINMHVANPAKELYEWPSMCFGIEMAVKDLENGGKRMIFPSAFTEGKQGIPINGLVWMADIPTMHKELEEKIKSGYNCIKIKVGNAAFEDELNLLAEIRKHHSPESLEIRLDANGAFKAPDALTKLEELSKYGIHSIEQPIRQGQWTEMEIICRESPIPIALDEELIGIYEQADKSMLISYIQPQYLIFKPSLLGGFKATEEWISIAGIHGVNWWVTSALESNIGLNAISQWAYTLKNELPQGLGTGQLYTNNIPSPLIVENAKLWYKPGNWDITTIT
jgi:L-alanine-DL-glutamate epimerase-like enolase superfamily enzyme